MLSARAAALAEDVRSSTLGISSRIRNATSITSPPHSSTRLIESEKPTLNGCAMTGLIRPMIEESSCTALKTPPPCPGCCSPDSTWSLRVVCGILPSAAAFWMPGTADLNASWMLSPRVLNSSERKTATPSVPPSWRKKVAELVATPISRGGTAFCTMIVRGCMHWPMPRPRNSIPTITQPRLVSALTRDSAIIETPASAEPMIGNIRILPVREVIWPTPMPAVIMPTTIGSIIRPALVGEAPCTICMYCGRTVIAPNIAAPTMTLAPMTTAAARSRKIRSGISASSPIGCSATTKPTTPTSADGVAGQRPRGVPAPDASLLGHGQQRHQRDHQGRGAPPVDPGLAAHVVEVQVPVDDEQRERCRSAR